MIYNPYFMKKKRLSVGLYVSLFVLISFMGVDSLYSQTVIDGVTVETNAVYFIGDTTAGNTLVITNNGQLFITNNVNGDAAIIGNGISSSNNTVLVEGIGSLWTNEGNITIGNTGAVNTLTISNGGRVENFTTILGIEASSSNNTLLITGANSVLTNQDDILIGYEGANNSIIISNAGTLANCCTYMGMISPYSTNNTVQVTGANSLWTNEGTIMMGFFGGANSITISNGGQVFASDTFVGNTQTSSNNLAIITGAGSLWSNETDFVWGGGSMGNSLSILDGAVLYNDQAIVGLDVDSSNNTILVAGSGSVWSNQSILSLGVDGANNTLIISNGGTVYSTNAIVGQYVTSTNNLLRIDGIGSRLVVTNSTGGGVLDIHQGTLHLRGGEVLADLIVATNGLSLLTGFGNLNGDVLVANGGSLSPGNSPGILNGSNMTWGSGGIYQWEILDTAGGAGSGWDLIDLSGSLVTGNPFAINIISMDSFSTYGDTLNFDPFLDYQWLITSASSISGFNAGDFTLNLSAFSNTFSGTWSISSDGSSVFLNYHAIPEPSTWALIILGAICAGGMIHRRIPKPSLH